MVSSGFHFLLLDVFPVCMSVSDALELELQTVGSCHVGAPGSLEEQSVLSTAEPSLSSPVMVLKARFPGCHRLAV